MDFEDLEPRVKKQGLPLFIDLSDFSIDELEARIAAMEGEIERCRQEIAGKKSTRASADAIFKSRQ